MAHSRAAQQELAELEKAAAPFTQCLEQAVAFLGTQLELPRDAADLEPCHQPYHGKEEWVLRWLLKKLQLAEDHARCEPRAWLLLTHVMRAVPVIKVARILEKRFLSIVSKALQEIRIRPPGDRCEDASVSAPSAQDDKRKAKKRKRRDVDMEEQTSLSIVDWLPALLSSMSYIVHQGTVTAAGPHSPDTGVLAAEHMRRLIRGPAQDVAPLLGTWLLLCEQYLTSSALPAMDLLHPFVTCWQEHIPADTALIQFSLHCTTPLLSLLRLCKLQVPICPSQIQQLEQLVARNIIVPAKLAHQDDAGTALWDDLTKVAILETPANSVVLFEVAVRCTHVDSRQKRKLNDSAWLQHIFESITTSLFLRPLPNVNDAVNQLLEIALHHSVRLSQQSLQKVTTHCVLKSTFTAWEILDLIIKVDPDMFCAAANATSLALVLDRVTNTSTDDFLRPADARITNQVLLPLMQTFARHRRLFEWLRLWHGELVKLFSTFASGTESSAPMIYSPWEDETMLHALEEHLELAFTHHQMVELLTWLTSTAQNEPAAACVLVEAVAGSLKREENVDRFALQLCQIVLDRKTYEALSERCRPRAWRVLTKILNTSTIKIRKDLATTWTEPYLHLEDLLKTSATNDQHALRDLCLEVCRSLCAAWTATVSGKESTAIVVKSYLPLVLAWGTANITAAAQQNDTEITKHDGYRGRASIAGSFARCIMVENPATLSAFMEVGTPADLAKLYDSLFLMTAASSEYAQAGEAGETRSIDTDMEHCWTDVIHSEEVSQHPKTLGLVVDTIVKHYKTEEMDFTKSLAISLLLNIPSEALNKKHRAEILRYWAEHDMRSVRGFRPDTLSLIVRLMRRQISLQYLKFDALVAAAQLENGRNMAEGPDDEIVFGLVLEMAKLIHSNTIMAPTEEHNKAIINSAITAIESRFDGKTATETSWLEIVLFMPWLTLLTAKRHDVLVASGWEASKLKDLAKVIYRRIARLGVIHLKDHDLEQTSLDRPDGSTWSSQIMLALLDATDLPVEAFTRNVLQSISSTSEDKSLDKMIRKVRKDSALPSPADIVDQSQNFPQLERAKAMTSIQGRDFVEKRIRKALARMTENDKLRMLRESMTVSETRDLDLTNLFLAKTIMASCEERPDDSGDLGDRSAALSAIYLTLCKLAGPSSSARRFCLITELQIWMLKSKPRYINQWHIDTTLYSISAICSASAPKLLTRHAGVVYLHICHLLRSILTSYTHGLKLQGHFHLLVQTMQSLLHCLFLPIGNHNRKSSTFPERPAWLADTHCLTAKHAVAYTSLLLSICDPTLSAITPQRRSRKAGDTLTSVKEMARKTAGQHMQHIIALYVRGQLEMRMLPEVREKLVPGIWAIFDVTTKESRRTLGETMDASGRAILGGLIAEWLKFGRWKG